MAVVYIVQCADGTLYTGWTTDGEMFDTTEASGKTRTFFVNGVIDGFAEGTRYALYRVGLGAPTPLDEEEEIPVDAPPDHLHDEIEEASEPSH